MRQFYTQAQSRLLHLFDVSATSKATVPSDVHQFTHKEFPGYDINNVFFLKHPNSAVQRLQLSGLCYMHAPAVVQHYKVANNHNVSMLDLKEFVKNNYTAEQLEQHIFNNQGGDSKGFLLSILQSNSIIISSDIATHVANYANYGVALVSQFRVHDDFDNVNIRHHYGSPYGNYIGLHAIALVGHRNSNGKQYYLLQNWWKEKQFVEVDDEYLERSLAYVNYIKTPQTGIPTTFPQLVGKFFELEAIDKPEGMCHEMVL